MLTYVFINGKNEKIKVSCSATEGNLPEFSAMKQTAEQYEQRLNLYELLVEAEAEKERRQNEYDELFYGNIGFFMQNYDEITATPKFANIMLPHPLFGSMYISFGGREITLGELLQLFKHESNYSGICPNCGGTVYLIRFGFSPLSGSVYPSHRCYGECKKRFSNLCVGTWGNKLRDIRMKYSSICTDEKSVHICELLRHLGKEAEFLPEYYKDNCIGGMRLGKSKEIVALTENGGMISVTEQQSSQSDITPQNPQSIDITVPQKAWTAEFTVAALKAGLVFGYIPGRYNNAKFLQRICDEFDYTPKLGEISPKNLTASVCIKALKDKDEHEKYKLFKLVPQHLKDEVLKHI